MKIFIGTAHFFAPDYRDAGMHRFAKTFATKGHHVDFVTFGQSQLKQWTKPEARRYARSATQAAIAGVNPQNIHAHVHKEFVHPLSGSKSLEVLTRPIERLYGRRLDKWAKAAAQSADIVILECGYALYYFEAIKALNPNAKYVAFYNDRVSVVGFRDEIVPLIKRLMPRFDLVRTNSEILLGDLPEGANGQYVPQGIDKSKMRPDLPSPYPVGSRNIVSIGNMLFDEIALLAIADADPDVTVHVIGAKVRESRKNIIVYGELPYEKTLPFIVHADAGLAPYRPVDGADYLLQSSLKIQQYSFAGLPILLNKDIGINAKNFVRYCLNTPGDVKNSVLSALSMNKSYDYGRDILEWDDVIDRLLKVIDDTNH